MSSRAIVRRTIAAGILLLTCYTIGIIHTGQPAAAPLAVVCAVLLLLLARAVKIAQRRREAGI